MGKFGFGAKVIVEVVDPPQDIAALMLIGREPNAIESVVWTRV